VVGTVETTCGWKFTAARTDARAPWQPLPNEWGPAFDSGVRLRSDRGIVSLSENDNALNVGLTPTGLALHEELSTLPALLLAVAARLGDLLQATWFGPSILVDPSVQRYPRPQPPFSGTTIHTGCTWQAHDKRVYPATGKVGLKWVERLERVELAPQMMRTQVGPFLVREWVTDATTPEAYDLELGRCHAWLGEALGLPIDSNYNELGDCLSALAATSPDPDLTYHHPIGVDGPVSTKAMVPDAAGRLDGAEVQKYRDWLAAGQTPSGTAMKHLWIAVPTRDAAVAVRDQVLEAGFDGVVYVETGRGLMDPFPAGPWLHELDPAYTRGVTERWRRNR